MREGKVSEEQEPTVNLQLPCLQDPMASPEAESLMELLRPYVHARILQEVVEKLDSQMCTVPTLLSYSDSTLKCRLDNFFPEAPVTVTDGIIAAIRTRKEDLRHGNSFTRSLLCT